jgi:iron complex outermembrane receptor protein
MKKTMTTVMCVLMVFTTTVFAQTQAQDSLREVLLDGVEVMATRANKNTPVAFTNISREELKQRNLGQDLPYLISMTPGAITTSDAGAGIGYTTIRVRGTDATRINVTANGIPINDAESHAVFWVNMPDLASSVKDIQVQRGVGTSTNGAGAFGASINMQTGGLSTQPYVEVNASAGSFGTHKETLNIGTGLLNGHWAFDARLSNISTDGYIDRASVHLNSYYLQGAWYGDKTNIKLITFTGKERTYHAWNYASKEEMAMYGRTYNSCGEYYDEQGNRKYYDDQTDNYVQNNWQLLLNHSFSNALKLNVGFHYTKGDGYYQEYKSNRKLVEYGMQPYEINGETVKKSDLIRKKVMDNWFAGGVFSLNYLQGGWNATLSGGFNRYDGDHYGRVLWVKQSGGDANPDRDYYFNNATKNDGNIYGKASYTFLNGITAFADLQYRHIDYKILGENDKMDGDIHQHFDVKEHFDFFNPKGGLSWEINPHHRVYASVGVAHKEPTRNNYTDGNSYDLPTSERLIDYELGYQYMGSWFSGGVNLYYMNYKDQLVLTGELNEIGEAMAVNMPKSYRVGAELMAGVKLPMGFSWEANATFSRNRIQDFTETLYDDDTYEAWRIEHGDTHIAFSPSMIVNNRLAYSYKGFDASLQTQYVSRQFMTNADVTENLLDAYCVSNLSLAYTFKMHAVKSITIGCTIYNIFNEEYENNGYAGSGYYTDGGKKIRYNYAGYAAQAGVNALANLTLRF